MPKPPDPIAPSLAGFEEFPYIVTRVVPAFYHLLLLPARLIDSELIDLARAQVLANRLDTCLAVATDYAVYFDPSGESRDADAPPAGGSIITGRLQAPAHFPESAEFQDRRRRLDEFAATSQTRASYLMGDLTKGGRRATDEEFQRLAGVEADGRPVGLERCTQCGGYRGTCLDPSETFRGQVMVVNCACENHNRCARCGEHLYERRLNANYYDPADGQIRHVPGFCGLSHKCERLS